MAPKQHQHRTRSSAKLPDQTSKIANPSEEEWYSPSLPWSAVNWDLLQWENYFHEDTSLNHIDVWTALQRAKQCESCYPSQPAHAQMVRHLEIAYAAMGGREASVFHRPLDDEEQAFRYPASFREKILPTDEEDLDFSGCYFPREGYEQMIMDRYRTLEEYEKRHNNCQKPCSEVCSKVRAMAVK